MNFVSDNATGVAPEILEALARGNAGPASPYGADPVTAQVEDRISEIFERPCAVFLVATGTAANALALSAVTPPYGSILCHEESHAHVHECGAPEFFSGGAKLIALAGANGKIDPFKASRAAERGKGDVHWAQPAALTITNATEVGTCYTPSEIAGLSSVCRRQGLALHMDGTRFANALATLDASPAQLSWKAGVDVLSLGATKNGALAAEAVIFFDPALACDMAFRRKRSGHLWSKMRYLSLQILAYLTDDLWLRNAAQANAMAKRLAQGLAALPGVEIAETVEANMVFAKLPAALAKSLRQQGAGFYDRGSDGVIRLVTAFDTTPEDVDHFIGKARKLGAPVTLHT